MNAALATWLPPTCPLSRERLTGSAVLASHLMDAIELDACDVDDAGVGAIFAYGGPLADLVRRAKFHPDESAARALVALWAKEAAHHVRHRDLSVDAIGYVPAHWRRRARRGFDLPALLAEGLAKELSRPIFHGVTCVRYRPPLSSGSSRTERADATKGCFVTAPPPPKLLLVDDVVTTGATLAEVREVLERKSATVWPVALARANRAMGAA